MIRPGYIRPQSNQTVVYLIVPKLHLERRPELEPAKPFRNISKYRSTTNNMENDSPHRNWRLKLRYGKLTTPYQHYTVLAEGLVGKLADGFSCQPGHAIMSMKTWTASADESLEMIAVIGSQIGFTITGRSWVYTTEPSQPPGKRPNGYDIKFSPFDPED